MDIDVAFKKRRSRYDLSKKASVSDQKITAMVQELLKHTPSPYNAQQQRAVVLLSENHDALWEIVLNTLKKETSEKQFEKTKKKIAGFANSYGTILFFNDQPTLERLHEKFPKYKDQFSLWFDQSQGMFQYAVWTRLASLGMGASLQHYNPLIDQAVHDYFEIPSTWKLEAQMPFGIPTELPKDKSFIDIEERFKLKK